jgi:hypothetical protein
LRDVLDGFSHGSEGHELILSHSTPLPLSSSWWCRKWLVRAIDDDGVGVLGVCPYSSAGEVVPSGSLEPMANLPMAIPPTKMVCISW